jgi:predicted ester cyclase
VRTYQDCWKYFNDKNWDAFGQCYTENAVSEEVDSATPSITGRAAIVEHARQSAASFPDRKGDVHLVLANGQHIMAIAVYTGTNTGPMPGPDGKMTPATNKKIGLSVGHTLEFDAAGRMGEKDAIYFDEGTMLAQLGVIKNPMARKAIAATGAIPTVVIGTNDDKERNNLVVAQNMIAAMNKHDPAAIEALQSDDYKLVEMGQSKDMNKKETAVSTKEFMAGFPDVSMTAATWTAGDYVVLEGHIEGTNKGPMPSMGIPKATNKPFKGRFVEVLKIDNNKIKEEWLFYNSAALATQLGLK